MATEHLFKTLVIGDPGAGKSSLIKRYVDGIFKSNYLFTIGVDFALKVIPINKSEIVRLQLWDVAGQERFGSLTRVYYQGASACVIVFDITQRRTFAAVSKWKVDLDSKVTLSNGQPVPCLLLANKCDLKIRAVSNEEIDRLAKDLGFIAWFETSAKDNINVDKAMLTLVQTILADDSAMHQPPPPSAGTVSLTAAPAQTPAAESYMCGGCMK